MVDLAASTRTAVPHERYSNRKDLKPVRRALRHRATPAERALWKTLKGRALDGYKFRRQHSVGPFILDFYCPDGRLAVELDGSVHDDPARAAYDADRQRTIEAYGIRVLRVRNEEVMETPDLVVAAIRVALNPAR